ncbi:hypothetical protein GURKE_02310 [Brevundimonas phage vB_BpoS-Gurke]|uniref:Uncharacterized protein n=1 Tax=Brevundimonas phage vB_BpoS-Gurke TaxID=2948599 RepID=A0A9E7N4B2_9CAUD|nr:hypothetical protein GURKE_02310 [Brevundimonas phage vB_BpoS-Gurke]
MHSTWELISDPTPTPLPGGVPSKTAPPAPRNAPITERMMVPGGYLYRVRSQGASNFAHAPQSIALAFVPYPSFASGAVVPYGATALAPLPELEPLP